MEKASSRLFVHLHLNGLTDSLSLCSKSNNLGTTLIRAKLQNIEGHSI